MVNRRWFIRCLIGGLLVVILGSIPTSAHTVAPLDVVVSEVAWSGMPADPNDEWIELYNNTGADIDLTGWRLYTADTPNITLDGVIPAHGSYLLERTDDTSVPDHTADILYTGALTNSPAEVITLTNSLAEVMDVIGRQPNGAWFAGTSTPDRRPMVRANLTAPGALASSWATGVPGGTPANSILDGDADTYGYSANIDWLPGQGSDLEAQAEDCNDANPSIYPGAPEALNHLDDDCDGQIDEGLVLGDFEYALYFNSEVIIEAMDTSPIPTEMELALLSHINATSSTIDVAFYGFDRQSLADALIAAHNRGVQVRIVGDDEAAVEYAPYYALLTNAGIPILLDTQSYIEHNKFAVLDGQVVWTGSTNWTDSCLTYNANNSLVITSTHLAEAYTAEFEEMFGGAFHNQKQDNTTHTFLFDGGLVESYFSPTDEVEAAVANVLAGAQESIYFAHFYWTSDATADLVVTKTLDGLDVSGVWDAVGAGNAYSEDEKLCAAGVPLKVEIFGGKVHDKFAVIDVNGTDPVVITGSYNWTASGAEQNDENTLIIHNPQVAQAYYKEYLRLYNALPPATVCADPSAESGLAACQDGSDNDYDGYVDAADFDCRESTAAACADGSDNDGDGDVDLADLDCYRCLLTGAAVSGNHIVKAGMPLTLTASVLPTDAPGPHTFTWSNENLLSADGSTAIYQWPVAGEYTVTLTATHLCKSESAVHVVTVTTDPLVGFAEPGYSAAESAGRAVITVTLDQAMSIPVTMIYSTADGTATAGLDYLPAAGVLEFTPGSVTAVFTVTPVDDDVLEPDETIHLAVSGPTGAILGTQTSAVLTIVDNDRRLVYLPLILRQDGSVR